MHQSKLHEIYADPGTSLSVYVPIEGGDLGDLDAAIADAAREASWFDRERARSAVEALDTDDMAGLALFAWPDRDPVVVAMASPPERTVMRLGDLPYAAPLLDVLAIQLAHIVVQSDDEGTEAMVVDRDGQVSALEVSPEPDALASAVAEAASASDARLVVVDAPPEKLPELTDRLAAAVPFSCEVEAATGPDELGDEVVRRVSDRTARDTVEGLRRFRFARSHDEAADGVAATVDALRHGRARLVLVHDDPDDDRTAQIGQAATAIAVGGHALAPDQGPTFEVRLVDAVIRAALLTGAEVRTIPEHLDDGPTDGLGASMATV